LVLFDGFKSDGASKIAFHLIKPYTQVNAAFTSADQASSVQPAPITSTQQGNEGHSPANEHTQQEDDGDDGSDNAGSGTGGWGSGSTPNAFRPLSDEPYGSSMLSVRFRMSSTPNAFRPLSDEPRRVLSTTTGCGI
jgi:hypothetical protein